MAAMVARSSSRAELRLGAHDVTRAVPLSSMVEPRRTVLAALLRFSREPGKLARLATLSWGPRMLGAMARVEVYQSTQETP